MVRQHPEGGDGAIRSARYDAATHAVTVVASRPLHYGEATGGIAVTEAHGDGGPAATPDPSHPRPGLTGAGGLPIEAVYSPGRFVVNVFPGLHPGL